MYMYSTVCVCVCVLVVIISFINQVSVRKVCDERRDQNYQAYIKEVSDYISKYIMLGNLLISWR